MDRHVLECPETTALRSPGPVPGVLYRLRTRPPEIGLKGGGEIMDIGMAVAYMKAGRSVRRRGGTVRECTYIWKTPTCGASQRIERQVSLLATNVSMLVCTTRGAYINPDGDQEDLLATDWQLVAEYASDEKWTEVRRK